MAAATTTTIFPTLAVVLLCVASLVGTGAAGGGGHHLETSNKANDLVARTCAIVTRPRRHYRGPGLTRQVCEAALRSDWRSAAARDASDLALVAMDLVRSAAVNAETRLDGALRSGTTARWSKHTMQRLRYCRQDHNGVAGIVPSCRQLVQEYNLRAAAGRRHGQGHHPIPAEGYLECAGRLVHDADDCWVHMLTEDRGAKKAVWKEIVQVASRANLAKAMVEQMVGVVDDDRHH